MSPEPIPPAAQHAEVFGRNNVVVQIQGDGNTVIPGVAHLELTRHLRLRRSNSRQARGISGLLSPYTYSIPFVGREDVVADLWRWMERDHRPVSVRVLVAPGGSGKTRLALELCDQATARGWDAGFVTDTELKRFFDKENLSAWGWSRPTLIVLDYAASKAQLLGKWFSELAGNPATSGAPLRLLLLERRADPSLYWWGEAFGKGGRQALAVQPLLDPEDGPFVLPRLPAEYRRRVFEAIVQEIGVSGKPK
ncbi:MAG TPA: hypothetical protein VLQ45_22105 [Thermoanaerobaculia bacterium]|nr:hypothetical protein [Thermoanaerobaculia bacterium]